MTELNDICFIIQARMGSKRLPRKMGMDFLNNETIPELIITKLQNGFPKIPIILATTENKEDSFLAEIAYRKQIKIFQGSESNVLKRFIDAANKFGYKKIIRVCADNPFLDVGQLSVLMNNISNHDYISFWVNGKPSIQTHFGFWTEYVHLNALKKVRSLTNESFFEEHVTNYIYSNPDQFSIHWLNPHDAVLGRNDIRMTIDTFDDFNLMKKIYFNLFEKNDHDFGIQEIINYLDENPEFYKTMATQITLNSK